MHERPAGESTNYRIRDYLLRVSGKLDEILYLQLRLYQGMIRRWPGEMILVSFDDDENLSSPVRPLKKFLCGILSDTTLVLDEKHGVFLPTGGKHLNEQSHEHRNICTQPIDLFVSRAEQGPKSNPNIAEMFVGDYRVAEWLKEKRPELLFEEYWEEEYWEKLKEYLIPPTKKKAKMFA